MLTCKLDCLSLQAPGLLPMKGGISDCITLHQESICTAIAASLCLPAGPPGGVPSCSNLCST